MYLVIASGNPTARHRIGGSSTHPELRLHLLLDTREPELEGLNLPGTHFPIYWSIHRDCGWLTYQSEWGESLQVIEDNAAGGNFTGLPVIPETPAELIELAFDAYDLEDLRFYSGIYGLDHLPDVQRAVMLERLRISFEENFYNDPPSPVEEQLYYAGHHPFCQQLPASPCPRTTCPNAGFSARNYRGTADLLVWYRPDPQDRPLYQELMGADNGELIWQVCRLCGSVMGMHYCT